MGKYLQRGTEIGKYLQRGTGMGKYLQRETEMRRNFQRRTEIEAPVYVHVDDAVLSPAGGGAGGEQCEILFG